MTAPGILGSASEPVLRLRFRGRTSAQPPGLEFLPELPLVLPVREPRDGAASLLGEPPMPFASSAATHGVCPSDSPSVPATATSSVRSTIVYQDAPDPSTRSNRVTVRTALEFRGSFSTATSK